MYGEMERVAEELRRQRDRNNATGGNLSNLARRLDSSRQGGQHLVNPQYSMPVGVYEVDLDNAQFSGVRLLPDADNAYSEDFDLAVVVVDVPANMAMPPVNAIVHVQFLGIYSYDDGGNEVREPRYLLTGGSGTHVMFTVSSVSDDYLICKHYPSEVEVYVFKPFTLMRTPFHNQTIEGVTYTYSSGIRRTANNGSSEVQLITPDYITDQPIYAVPIDSGMSQYLNVYRPDSSPLVWMDANFDARAWAVDI
jgi:hypothetical protein